MEKNLILIEIKDVDFDSLENEKPYHVVLDNGLEFMGVYKSYGKVFMDGSFRLDEVVSIYLPPSSNSLQGMREKFLDLDIDNMTMEAIWDFFAPFLSQPKKGEVNSDFKSELEKIWEDENHNNESFFNAICELHILYMFFYL